MKDLPSNGRWRLAFIPYWTRSAPETVEALSRLGYDGVEWMAYMHFMTADELKAVVAVTRDGGLEVSDLMCSQDLVSGTKEQKDERVKFILDKIASARAADVGLINLFTGPAEWSSAQKLGKDILERDAWPYVIDAFRRIVDTAEKNDVTITVEAAFNMLVHDYYTLREFLGNFDSKNLAVNMDPSHLVLYGNDPELAVRRLGKRIRHVHVKDAIGKPGTPWEDFMFPMLGEGMVDWKGFFQALSDIGYEGFLSVEFESENYLKNVWRGDWTKAAAASKEQVDALVSLIAPATAPDR